MQNGSVEVSGFKLDYFRNAKHLNTFVMRDELSFGYVDSETNFAWVTFSQGFVFHIDIC